MTSLAKQIKRVAVIGGGPSGLALIKALNGEPHQFSIDLYETRSNLGGIWNYLETKSNYSNDREIGEAEEKNFSPMYKKLETNIIHKNMEFANFKFPEGTEDFPFRTEILKYLTSYSKTIGPHEELLNTKVTLVDKVGDDWYVESENLVSGKVEGKKYDAVIVANGHFEVPRYPDTKGLGEWEKKDPQSVMHAKFYDNPEPFKDKTVLIVGGYSSGSDIAVQCSSTGKKIYVSCDEATVLRGIDNKYVELIPRIDEYNVEERSITFNGQTIKGIDTVIVCTGYLYDVPFLKLDICEGRYIKSLYKQIFYIEDPTLTFVGLAKDVSPFPLGEAQATIIARFYSGRLKLPSHKELKEITDKELDEKGDRLHGLKYPKEAEYINGLFKWLEDENLLDGFLFDKLEGEKAVIKESTADAKLKRIIANTNANIAGRK